MKGQLFEYGFSVHDDACIPGLKKMAQAMKSGGAKAILQLTHAGRFANHYVTTNKRAVGPSYMELNSPVEHIVHPSFYRRYTKNKRRLQACCKSCYRSWFRWFRNF